MSETKNILLTGVGGQGIILAGNMLTQGLMAAGYDVKMSEIHGMSQRGGSVSSQVRYGAAVQSPVIEKGSADILVGFETMETLRWLPYLRPDGEIVANDYQINPMPVTMGKRVYAQDILRQVASWVPVTVVKADEEAKKLGNIKSMNVILLGAIIKKMHLEGIDWEKIVRDTVKQAFAELNIQAVKRGMELV